MTQAQLDLQTQREQNSTDLTTKPLFNDCPVLFLDFMDESPINPCEQVEHHNKSPKDQTPPETFTVNQSREPPPSKTTNEIMKDPACLASPIYYPILPPKHSLSTTRDDHHTYRYFLITFDL